MKERCGRAERFCGKYLQCMDPDQAAAAAGCGDGYAMLETKLVQRRLERMREAAAGQVRREDAVRRLAQLAFGRVNDAARLALHSGEADLESLDLSAVAELKVTDKGGVEIKLIDRIRALEALCGLLSEEKAGGAGELYRVLADAAGEEGGWDDGRDHAAFPQAAEGADLVVPPLGLGGHHLRRRRPQRQDLFHGAVFLPVVYGPV